MDSIYGLFVFLNGSALFVAFLWFGWVAYFKEHYKRAAVISSGICFTGLLLVFVGLFATEIIVTLLAYCLGVFYLVAICFFPINSLKKYRTLPDTPVNQVDERDIMFARARLVRGSPEYKEYYSSHPENRRSDDITREKPGLLSATSKYYHALSFASASASFDLTQAMQTLVEGKPDCERIIKMDPSIASEFLKGLAQYYGALDTGITRLRKYHVYSHVGRGSGVYGQEIVLNHEYAIVFTVEMSARYIRRNPLPPGVMESAKQYVEAGRIAVQIAQVIRSLGYEARAHIDGNYRVIAPLIARDAGLGEIGRMGLLMTPRQGPRVRIAVVTTTMPLTPDDRKADYSVIDFCNMCKKCAETCPVKAIPFGEQILDNGAYRWKINADICFRYWNVVGTDCGKCMTVCPYSHPNWFPHNLLRAGIKRSTLIRWIAIKLDDIFYDAKDASVVQFNWLDIPYEERTKESL